MGVFVIRAAIVLLVAGTHLAVIRGAAEVWEGSDSKVYAVAGILSMFGATLVCDYIAYAILMLLFPAAPR